MTTTAPRETSGCVTRADLFQHRLLEDPPAAASAAERRRAAALTSAASKVCGDCPIRNQCLYTAVIDHDVAGFVAGTTERDRLRIRRELGWRVEPENLDTMAGAFAANRQVDHDEIVRLRHANPHESLEVLAHRMGCSLSTVKRHLRRARQERARPTQRPTRIKPSMRRVLTAARRVLTPQRQAA